MITTLATINRGRKGRGNLKCESDSLGRGKGGKRDKKTVATKKQDFAGDVRGDGTEEFDQRITRTL